MKKLSVITRCTRLQHLPTIQKSVFSNSKMTIDWHIIFDTSVLKDIDFEVLESLKGPTTFFHIIKGKPGDLLYPQSMEIVKQIKEGYIYYLDDDNILPPDFIETVSQETCKSQIYTFDQFVDGKDFTRLEYRIASPENTKYQGIDLAQLLFHHSVFEQYEFIGDYAADGYLAEKIYNEHPNWFKFLGKTLCYYNYLVGTPKPRLPRILYIGDDQPELRSIQPADFEADELDVVYDVDDSNLLHHLKTFNPDAIVTVGDNWESFNSLSKQPSEIRRKWLNVTPGTPNIGQIAYELANSSMIEPNIDNIISYFTPIYNTGNKLYKLYESLINQTNKNWEWVMVNDSTDGGKTLMIAEDIASKDSRIKVFDFRVKSKGNVGEAKWRAACMTQGFLLAELDHDDYLTPDCTQMLYDACEAYPDAGFYYTDSCEVDESWKSLTYGEGFAMGYGAYRDESSMGIDFQVQVTPNINPKTIRHIVGVPNHVRSWRRDTYFAIGGHNRSLTIADDYELIVRTFLKTKMCRIPKLGYIQFIYNDGNTMNTHELSRKDIQRRVRSIMYYYNERIAQRFEELGLKDWAYDELPSNPWGVESKYGEEENYANYNFIPNSNLKLV